MKNLWKFMAAALLITLAGCEKKEPLEKPGENGTEPPIETVQDIDIYVTAPEIGEVIGDEQQVLKCFDWENTDKLIAVGFDGPSTLGESELTFQNAKGEKAYFKGKGIEGATSYRIYYKSANLSIDRVGKTTIKYENLQYYDRVEAFKNYLLLGSEELKIEQVAEGAEVKLDVRNTIMLFMIQSSRPGINTLKTATWIRNYGSATSAETAMSVQQEINGVMYLLFFFDPEDMQADANLALELEGDNTYIVSGTNPYTQGYEAGKMYKVTIATVESTNTIHDWKAILPLNELWFKTADGTPMTLADMAEAAGQYVESISSELNADGYYIMKTKADLVALPDGAFEGNLKIAEIVFPEGMTYTGQYSLKGCTNLKKVTLPESLEILGEEALRSSGIEYLRIPANVKEIQGSSVRSCPNLVKVDCLAKAKTIMGSAFNGNGALQEVNLSAELEELQDYAFWQCRLLKRINLPKNAKLTKLGMNALGYVAGYCYDDYLQFPHMKNLTDIGKRAFRDVLIEKIEIGKAAVGEEAFSGCTSTTSLTIGADVISFASKPFYNVSALQNLTILATPENKAINQNTFAYLNRAQDYTDIALHLHKNWKTATENAPADKVWMGYTWKSIDFVESDGTAIK